MALLAAAGTEDELEYSNQTEDEEYVCLPSHGSTEQEEEEEEEEKEYVSLPSHDGTEEEEEEEMDEEQQVLCEVLCADRVGQMTKTYNDIDAVTRLLEEKERDLELAARIGQSLLKKNKALSERNELLEEQVEHIREEVSQLRHDLSMKDELLQFYTSAAEESEGESITSTPETNVSTPTFFPLDSLQKKLKDLEEENKSLRSEASHLETETISYEEKEQQLVNDCVKELRNSNMQISSLAEELARKSDDASRQQEEITHLLSQIVDLQKKAKLYAVENEELTQHLGAAKDAQRQLTAELQELQDKYAECMEMLHEAQEELKNLRNKTLPLSTSRRFHSLGLFPMDSLAAEIEGTMRKELQMDDPDVEEQRLQPKRVFQTVKNLNLMRQQRSSLAPSPLNIPGSNQTSCLTSGRSSRVGTPLSLSMYGSEMGSGIILDNRTSSILENSDDGSEDSNKRPPGTPGTPGSRDLEAALRRLSLRRDNYLSEKRFFEEERERKLAYLAKEEEKGGGGSSGDPGTPTESLLSLCSHPSLGSVWSGYSITARSYLPEKLQIVKPLEGSATLHAWQQLAQPHMGALLDHRPGVVTKGFRSLAHEHEQEDGWQLDQPEEDELSCDSFTGLPGEGSAPMDLLHSTSTPSVCNKNGEDNSQSETLRGDREAIQFKDGHVANMPLSFSRPSPSSSPLPSSSEMNGHVDLKELQALQAAAMDRMPGTPPKTTSTSLGLVRLLLEHGISASVYDPRSWDRGFDASGASTPVRGAHAQRSSDSPGETETRRFVKRPDSLFLQPSTPPNSPRSKTASSASNRPVFQFSPCSEDPPFYDTFLASKPARTILREVLGEAERERAGQTEDDSQTEMLKLRLVDKLKCFRALPPHAASGSSGSTLLAPFGSTGLGKQCTEWGAPRFKCRAEEESKLSCHGWSQYGHERPGRPPEHRDTHTTYNANPTYSTCSAHTGNGKVKVKSHTGHQDHTHTTDTTCTGNRHTTDHNTETHQAKHRTAGFNKQ
ncbi:Trafficking kinesin-binding protein 1 106 kDa O-GlcNAc transferase-interacting protein [Collichthys lucidus]|uniref:Trafficking kinesin-binding protein 1 106 kDa O-GlcNAc transferase-interacting protein n=1 Tax=Collichthys lucidus TaxID=240159 RepID=A0A4U5V204_COLLU|nr:Trafficking kinesin-binding protein 1 106 kDa O-GlcNAc transferase-interacting protein [Collichthys lucidus]